MPVDINKLPTWWANDITIPTTIQSAAARSRVLTVEISFETGEQGTHKIYFPVAVTIKGARAQVIKAIAAADNGTITLQNAAGANITPNAVMTFTAGAAAFTTEVNNSQVSTANNSIAAGSFCQLVAAKTTAGGRVRYTLEYELV